MGTHYLNMDYGNKTDCRKASPMQLIYIDNHLVGFALQHGAPLGFGELEDVLFIGSSSN